MELPAGISRTLHSDSFTHNTFKLCVSRFLLFKVTPSTNSSFIPIIAIRCPYFPVLTRKVVFLQWILDAVIKAHLLFEGISLTCSHFIIKTISDIINSTNWPEHRSWYFSIKDATLSESFFTSTSISLKNICHAMAYDVSSTSGISQALFIYLW